MASCRIHWHLLEMAVIESLPLRQAVWNAEKPGSNPRKIARNGRNFGNLAHPPDWRKCPTLPSRQALRPVSLKDPLAVRFQRLQQAKAMRSQTDDSAKAGLTFSFSIQWELVRGSNKPT